MRATMASWAHQSSAAAVSHCRGLRRSESGVLFGASLRLSRPPPPRSATSCQMKREPFRPSKVDLLEPSVLGIRPETPNWEAREDLMRDCIARRANCVELPLSLRIIKEKKKMKRSEAEEWDSISKAFSCTVLVIRELQTHALRSRALALQEDDVHRIHSDMNSSFLWLFREVFSRTPDLMAAVMLLVVDFAAHSLEEGRREEQAAGVNVIMSSHEKKLWDSMAEQASIIRLQGLRLKEDEDDPDPTIQQHFISPVQAVIQGDDDYDDYNRTELLYQIGVYQEPHNSLLLCNYAQFLCLVTRNYDRAEECFERAVEADPIDGEVLSQYATFLWVVRKDMWGAEERFQQAMAAEPDNPYHASKYANFLWTTGGEDTCYPL